MLPHELPPVVQTDRHATFKEEDIPSSRPSTAHSETWDAFYSSNNNNAYASSKSSNGGNNRTYSHNSKSSNSSTNVNKTDAAETRPSALRSSLKEGTKLPQSQEAADDKEKEKKQEQERQEQQEHRTHRSDKEGDRDIAAVPSRFGDDTDSDDDDGLELGLMEEDTSSHFQKSSQDDLFIKVDRLWSTVCRVDLERYLLYKNAQLHSLADTSGQHLTWVSLQHLPVWHTAVTVLAKERAVFRRRPRVRHWPRTMRAHLPSSDVDAALQQQEEDHHLGVWIKQLEDLGDTIEDEVAREVLAEVPVPAIVRQTLADRYTSVGEYDKAAEILVRSVRTGPGIAKPHDTPLLFGWEQLLQCSFVQAHQCLRFGRLALLSARALLRKSGEDGLAYTESLRRLKERGRREEIERGVAWARRHLASARDLFNKVLQDLGDVSKVFTWSSTQDGCFRAALRCSKLLGLLLLAEATALLERSAESTAAAREAVSESEALQADAWVAPRLRGRLRACQELAALLAT